MDLFLYLILCLTINSFLFICFCLLLNQLLLFHFFISLSKNCLSHIYSLIITIYKFIYSTHNYWASTIGRTLFLLPAVYTLPVNKTDNIFSLCSLYFHKHEKWKYANHTTCEVVIYAMRLRKSGKRYREN